MSTDASIQKCSSDVGGVFSLLGRGNWIFEGYVFCTPFTPYMLTGTLQVTLKDVFAFEGVSVRLPL